MNSKLISLCIIICFVGYQSFAQQNSGELLRLQKVEKYQKIENTGMTLTAVGSVLFVVGAMIVHNSTVNLLDGRTDNPEVGLLCTVLGVGGLGSGIPLWIVGANNRKKYSWQPAPVSIRLNANPRQQGLTLTFRF